MEASDGAPTGLRRGSGARPTALSPSQRRALTAADWVARGPSAVEARTFRYPSIPSSSSRSARTNTRALRAPSRVIVFGFACVFTNSHTSVGDPATDV